VTHLYCPTVDENSCLKSDPGSESKFSAEAQRTPGSPSRPLRSFGPPPLRLPRWLCTSSSSPFPADFLASPGHQPSPERLAEAEVSAAVTDRDVAFLAFSPRRGRRFCSSPRGRKGCMRPPPEEGGGPNLRFSGDQRSGFSSQADGAGLRGDQPRVPRGMLGDEE